MKRILIVGQTPPPYGGQAIMIKYMLEGKYEKMETYHVRMCFSKDFNDRGKFSFYKLIHIFSIVINIWKNKFQHGVQTMYYPISSTPKVALLRDVIIIGCTRFLFKKIIYHFHAAGISEELPKYNKFLRSICFNVLKNADLGITSSKYNPKDAEYLQCKKIEIIPLGIPDYNVEEKRKKYGKKNSLTILFLGLLNTTKGEGYILEAINILNKAGYDIHFTLAGKFESEEYKNVFFNKVKEFNLQNKVEYKGVITGIEKENTFLNSDVFCFPSFFSSESFGIVLLEGMMYQMPLIASRWRGVQSVIEENRNGFLVDIKNTKQIVDAIEILYKDRMLVEKMGKESRKIFIEKYELSNYLTNIERAIVNI